LAPATAPVSEGSGTTSSSGGATNSVQGLGKHFLDVEKFPTNLMISGGVAKDGIPALTRPDFVFSNSEDAGYLSDADMVLGVFMNGVAKAYPHNIGWHHEIVNDVISRQDIVVTVCPLTGTGLVFNGSGDLESPLELGVSGLQFNNNLVMYDRRDDATLYPQMTLVGISGLMTGNELTLLPVIETTWQNWKRMLPNTRVVSASSSGTYSFGRYTFYPYSGYREPNSGPFFPLFPSPDGNLRIFEHAPKEVALVLRFGRVTKAYPFSSMGGEEVFINDTVAGENVVVVYYAEGRLALTFKRDFEGRSMTFDRINSTDDKFPFMMQDRETGTVWDLLGRGISGELANSQLHQIAAHNTLWFAWANFWQETKVYIP
tara:strand:+ start:255 stop:1373 length:1119 start_codon:yes stop_codon:yes gene_type:complete